MTHRHRKVWNWKVLFPVVLVPTGHAHQVRARHHRYVAPVKIGDFSSRPKSEALIKAVGDENFAEVRRFLDSGVSPNAVDDPKDVEGKSALQIAAGTGNMRIVRLLLDRGADINAPDVWGGTALISATVAAETETVKLLISRGADVNANDDGVTALGWAAHWMGESKSTKERRRWREIVSILRQAGAKERPWERAGPR